MSSGARIGQGFDVHRFAEAPDARRPLVLGGVHVADSPGLVGHSDADVLSHALADAVLGAAGGPDLGTLFPADDPRYAGADSLDLLRRCVARAAEAGFTPVNADCTVLCERPKLAGAVPEMAKALTAVLGAPVAVRAKHAEGLGAFGRGEGVAAMAVVLLEGSGWHDRDVGPPTAAVGDAGGAR